MSNFETTSKISSPILLTGAHRSGTTWLANMLTLNGQMQIASEPFNLDSWAYQLNNLADDWFTYAPALNQAEAVSAFNRVLRCNTGKVYGRRTIQRYLPFTRKGRLLIKDPIACMSSEWLAQNFSLNMLVIVRHPAAFAASLKRMQWHFPFEHLLRQERLVDELLFPFKDQMASGSTDIIEQAALIWNVIYHVLSIYIERNHEWTTVKHETLSRNPVGEIRDLYSTFGLQWSSQVENDIYKYTGKGNSNTLTEGVAHQMVRDSEKNISRWKTMLTEKEISIVRQRTESVSSKFYTDSEW